MSTSVYKIKRSRQILKTIFVYLGISAFSYIFDKIYSLFGHGVYSSWMSLMFLYPLLGGTLGYILLWLLKPSVDMVAQYRAYYNLYNSGIATLVIGSMLKGIFDIAGTSSPYTVIFLILGCILMVTGVVGFLINGRRQK